MMDRPTYYCLLDLETTGSDENADPILEIGFVVVDADLSTITVKTRLIKPSLDVSVLKEKCAPVVRDMHTVNGLWDDLVSADVAGELLPLPDVEDECVGFLQGLGKKHDFVLAGSGVAHFDRRFLKAQMPRFEKWFRYYCIDVGILRRTLRDIVGRPDLLMAEENKAHRALDDAKQHLRELQFIKAALAKEEERKV